MKLNEDDETVSSCEEICSELDISVLGNEELHKSVSRLKDDLERCIHEVNKNTRLTRQIDDDVTELVDFKDGIHSKLRLYAQE
jgi:CHASE3 domain sensor protein